MKAFAIDLGGSHATCAVVSDDGVLACSTVTADGGGRLADLLPSLALELHQLSQKVGLAPLHFDGLALSFCGIVDARAKRVISTNKKFDDAITLDLEQWCRSSFDLPFAIENDARMALLGELAAGAAKEANDAVMITLGTGIGGAAAIDRKLLNSRHCQAGTLGGHIPIAMGGRKCTCGNIGCAEAEASTAFLTQIYQAQPGSGTGLLAGEASLDFARLFAASDRGDPAARSALDHCIHVWSVLSVALIHAYDPEVLVFGGSVMKRAEDILPQIQKYVDAHAWTPWGSVQVLRGTLGNQAALHGAIPLLETTL